MVEVHQAPCPRCGRQTERIPFLAGKAHRMLRYKAAVACACGSAPLRRVATQWGPFRKTVRQIDKRALQRCAAQRPRKPLRYLGVDEIYLGKQDKFLTVVSNLETRQPLWVEKDQKRETLDRFFAGALPPRRRCAVRAVCVDMWEPFTQSLRAHLPRARIVYDKFHVLKHANAAIDDTRRADFFRL